MKKGPLEIRVECYAGYRGEETPRCFFVHNRCIDVAQVIDRWLDPDHRYFKVRGDDDGRYILRHDAASGVWEIILFENDLLPEKDS